MSAALTIENPAYFERLAEIEAVHWWSQGMWRLASRWIRRHLRGRRGLRVLDVGCGTGLNARRLVSLGEVESVSGLDPSETALGLARERHALPGIDWVQGSATDLPFDSTSFDLVTCFDVLQHLPDGGAREAGRELARVLRPGGLALVRANGRGWGVGTEDAPLYTLGGLVEVVSSAGLVVRRASYANCLPALAQEVRGRLASRTKGSLVAAHPAGGGLAIRVPVRPVNGLMSCVAAAEAFLAGSLGVRLPFGHSTMVLAETLGHMGR